MGWTDGRMDGCMDWMDAWMHGCMDAWMHGRMNEWMDACVGMQGGCVCFVFCLRWTAAVRCDAIKQTRLHNKQHGLSHSLFAADILPTAEPVLPMAEPGP